MITLSVFAEQKTSVEETMVIIRSGNLKNSQLKDENLKYEIKIKETLLDQFIIILWTKKRTTPVYVYFC